MVKFLVISDFGFEIKVNKIIEIIEKNNPNCVLFAGDLICDDGNDKADPYSVFEILKYCENKGIMCLLVKGNHDERFINRWNELIDMTKEGDFNYVQDISNKRIILNGISIFGLPYDVTHYKSKMEKLSENFQQTDIILTHSKSRAFYWFSKLNTNLIITGHFGNGFINLKDKIILRNDMSPDGFISINYNDTTNIEFSSENHLIDEEKLLKTQIDCIGKNKSIEYMKKQRIPLEWLKFSLSCRSKINRAYAT